MPILSSPFSIEVNAARKLSLEYTWAHGGIRSDSVPADPDGVYRDLGYVYGWIPDGPPITISHITSGNPAVATYSGRDLSGYARTKPLLFVT